MTKINLANILLICSLGTLYLWPKLKIEPKINKNITTAYQSVCQVTTAKMAGSGVLLESGYILTAAHCVDRNFNGKIEENEKIIKLTFPYIKFKTDAEVIHASVIEETDIAILKPKKYPPITGVQIMSTKEYNELKIGTPLYTIGMQSGLPKANITDGRLISLPIGENKHRNSANSYKGNSGGGVFIGDKLIGIASQIGIGEHYILIPIFYIKEHEEIFSFKQIMKLPVSYTFPMANQSVHVPAPSIRNFLKTHKFKTDPLWEQPPKCPYKDYYSVFVFNATITGILIFGFIIIRKLWK